MNQVILIGRLTRAVELKEIGTNHFVVNNTLAISRNHRDNSGEIQSDFIPFIAWNRQAELLHKYCQKGQRIAISGRMQSRSYTNSENKQVYVVECLVNEITLLDRLNSQKTKKETEEVANAVN